MLYKGLCSLLPSSVDCVDSFILRSTGIETTQDTSLMKDDR
jgi:hypothetical protein